jgi:hypothetical protein
MVLQFIALEYYYININQNVYPIMEYEQSFRVTFRVVGPWSESEEHRYYSDESKATAFMNDINKCQNKCQNRPWAWIDRVMMLRINGDLYDLNKSGKCVQIE